MGNERKRKLSIFLVCSFLWRQSRFSWRVELTRMDPAVAIPVTATKPSATMGIYKVQLCAQRLISQPRTPTHNYYWSYCGRNRTEKTGRENKNWTKRETDRKRERREISQGENLDTKKKKKIADGRLSLFFDTTKNNNIHRERESGCGRSTVAAPLLLLNGRPQKRAAAIDWDSGTWLKCVHGCFVETGEEWDGSLNE